MKWDFFSNANFDFFKNFYSKWDYSTVEDYLFINLFILDNLNYQLLKNKLSNKFPPFLQFLSRYYFYILDKPLFPQKEDFIDDDLIDTMDFFLLLSTKHSKTKYAVNNWAYETIISASIGMVLKYYGRFKKAFKRSYRANLLLIRFIRNTITRFIFKRKFIFIVDGFNSKLFSFIGMFIFIGQKTNMTYYLVKPKITFGLRKFKKIKAIKRKLQRKNASNISRWTSHLKKYEFKNYKI